MRQTLVHPDVRVQIVGSAQPQDSESAGVDAELIAKFLTEREFQRIEFVISEIMVDATPPRATANSKDGLRR